MGSLADIPSDFTDGFKAFVFQYLDAQLNSKILFALLYGVYTGILAVTLWNIFINKCWPIRRAMVVVIVLLHALITINFGANWSYIHSAFIKNGRSFWTVDKKLSGPSQAAYLEMGISASMSAILADLYMIWYCWMVWGRRWLAVLLPILSLISATASKIMAMYSTYFQGNSVGFPVLYSSLFLVTTLWCTLLIIYRIVTVAGVGRGAEGRLRVYCHLIEVLVESSALYSISLILFLAFTIREDFGLYYFDVIAGIAKGLAPTLLIGRITAGHRARSDDSWQGSVIGSASIRSRSQEHSRTSLREDDQASPTLNGDLEAQRESSVEHPSPTLRSVCVVADYTHPNTDVSSETSPYLRNRSLYHGSSLYEDASRDSTVVDEATALSR
ncbi:hypothetical protein ARMSODRAFT_959263 [Armillaria solidipes]|uniref:Family A G protein-coupled receptor-like protein n=1 Tax=Armillaria solidipes TaxID=1076256 RepID=A0A2H3BD86_9AGAR|nr:hypothetical protein ARMSODRAFT_959263 [Armillaria solidipes]